MRGEKISENAPTPPYAGMCEHEPWLEVQVFTFPISGFSFVSRPSNVHGRDSPQIVIFF